MKLYDRPQTDKIQLLQYVLELGKNLGDDERFLAWPSGIVAQRNGQPCVGVVTRRVAPPADVPLYKLIFSPRDAVEQFRQDRSWMEYIKIARGTASAVRTVHGLGMAHGDIHLKNFLANPITGEVVLIDLDGVIVKGFTAPQVKGMRGFMAPEIEMGQGKPDGLTDRYSAAVLILWILLLHNVMQPQVCYDDMDQKHDDELGYGQHACFSEHPNDRRNWQSRIGTPLFRNGILSYRMLTPKLQTLTEAALIEGLHDPTKRPQVVDWDRALAEAYDVLVHCPACRQTFIYPYWVQPAPRRQCPFCGTTIRPPFPALLELMEARSRGLHVSARYLALYNGLPLFADVLEPGRLPPFTRRGLPLVGQTAWDPAEGAHRLLNTSDHAWQIIAGGSGAVGPGIALTLRPGMLISFGEGKRLARVLE